jgi:hypothetical protein
MIEKKYIKKVIVADQNSSPELRAERLRKIRNLANLSRKEICSTDDFKLNTYKGWELGRFGGLPVDGAERVIKRVAEENVICSLDWLLHAKGREPYLLPTGNENLDQNTTSLILKEIMLFQNSYPDAIYTEIKDDALMPGFMPGDYVAGIRRYGNTVRDAANQICIIQLVNGQTLVRNLKIAQDDTHFYLMTTNIASIITGHIITSTDLVFAAPVIRHYKNV